MAFLLFTIFFGQYFCSLIELLLQVDLKFYLGEEKTFVSSKITVFPRVEGSILTILLHFSFVESICIFDIMIIHHLAR